MPILGNCTLKFGAQAVSAAYFRGQNLVQSSVWKFAASRNKYPKARGQINGAGLTAGMIRYPIKIGSGSPDKLKLLFSNAIVSSSGEVNTGNAFTIIEAALERVTGGAQCVPVYFGGSRSVTIDDGAVDVLSDEILASSFTSMPLFNRGDQYYIKLKWSVASVGMYMPCSRAVQESGSVCAWRYDPATTFYSSVDVPGDYTRISGGYRSTEPNSSSFFMCPMVIGLMPADRKPAFLTLGDSLIDGTVAPYAGTWMQYACNTAASGQLAHAEVAAGGASQEDFTGAHTKWRSVLKYADIMVDEIGTNNPTLNVSTLFPEIWTAARAAGVKKIYKPKLLPRTTSTDSWATEASQTYQVGGAGGVQDAFNTTIAGFVGNGIDGVLQISAVRGADPFKWLGSSPSLTTDGTHITDATASLIAAEVAPILDAMTI